MGRKSAKGKEKRLRRKEELEILKAKQAIVDAANAMEDPMELLQPFKKYERNGLNVSLTCCKTGKLDCDTLDWAFSLVKDNMQTLYEESEWGWSDDQKQAEMREDLAWYIIARDQAQSPVACVHFRFDLECEDEVLYCYEIQLTKSVRRKGLGKFMMQILELLAYKTQMIKVMLTAFKHNGDAQNFFVKKLKYQLDETNLEESLMDTIFDESEGSGYTILSKTIPQKKPAASKTPLQTQQTNGQTVTASS